MNIVYYAKDLILANLNNDLRGGIYFTDYNVANILLNDKDVNLYFYLDKDMLDKASILNSIFPNKNIKLIYDFSKLWLDTDIFFTPIYMPNILISNIKIKKCIIIYDLIPMIFLNNPEWNDNMLERIDKNYICICISDNTKKDFIKYAKNINANNVFRVHLACSEEFSPNKLSERILDKYDIPKDKKYIFSLCGIYPRKNLIRIIRTFFEFLDKHNIKDMIFLMGGYKLDDYMEEFNNEIALYKDRIVQIGYVADEDLPYLYSEAQWFVYTSQYEGFGLPPLEAMACGCPVIVSNNSSLPEVVGDAGIMIDYDSDKQHIEAYEKYYFNEEYRKEMAQKGLERSKLFSWEKCVGEMLKIMRNNIDRKNKPKLIKTEDFIYYRIFGLILTLPRLRSLFSVRKSEDERFIILTIFGIKIRIKIDKDR